MDDYETERLVRKVKDDLRHLEERINSFRYEYRETVDELRDRIANLEKETK